MPHALCKELIAAPRPPPAIAIAACLWRLRGTSLRLVNFPVSILKPVRGSDQSIIEAKSQLSEVSGTAGLVGHVLGID